MLSNCMRLLQWLARFNPGAVHASTPGINQVFQHLLLYTAGRGVLDAVQQQLRLSDAQMAPSRETLFRFGNTSSASTWYILANIERKKGVAQGDKILQVGFGGGESHVLVLQALQ